MNPHLKKNAKSSIPVIDGNEVLENGEKARDSRSELTHTHTIRFLRPFIDSNPFGLKTSFFLISTYWSAIQTVLASNSGTLDVSHIGGGVHRWSAVSGKMQLSIWLMTFRRLSRAHTWNATWNRDFLK